MNSCIYMGYQAPATSMASVPSITNADLRVAKGYLFLTLVPKGSTQCLEYAQIHSTITESQNVGAESNHKGSLFPTFYVTIKSNQALAKLSDFLKATQLGIDKIRSLANH